MLQELENDCRWLLDYLFLLFIQRQSEQFHVELILGCEILMCKKRVVSNFDLTPQTNQKNGKKKQTKKKT